MTTGIVHLAAGNEAIQGGINRTIGRNDVNVETQILDVSNCASVFIRLIYNPTLAPTGVASIQLLWWKDPAGNRQAGADIITPISSLLASGGDAIYIFTPVRTGFLSINFAAPLLAINETATLIIDVSGNHLEIPGLVWHGSLNVLGFAAPKEGEGPLFTARLDARKLLPGQSDASFRAQLVPVAVEATINFTQLLASDGYNNTVGSSFTVPAGKILRIQSIRAILSHTAAMDTTFRIRLTTALTGNLIEQLNLRIGAAGQDEVSITYPFGRDFPAGTVLQFSDSSSLAAGGLSVNIGGLLYDAA